MCGASHAHVRRHPSCRCRHHRRRSGCSSSSSTMSYPRVPGQTGHTHCGSGVPRVIEGAKALALSRHYKNNSKKSPCIRASFVASHAQPGNQLLLIFVYISSTTPLSLRRLPGPLFLWRSVNVSACLSLSLLSHEDRLLAAIKSVEKNECASSRR